MSGMAGSTEAADAEREAKASIADDQPRVITGSAMENHGTILARPDLPSRNVPDACDEQCRERVAATQPRSSE